MQFWPAKVVTPAAKSGGVEASGASSNTIIGVLPPSSGRVHPFQRLGSGRDQPADLLLVQPMPSRPASGTAPVPTGCRQQTQAL
jgi:hypothetical protein